MKAYLIRNTSPLPPFRKSASQVRLHDTTVGSRLRTQLAEIGCEVVNVDALDRASIAPGSLAVQDDLMATVRAAVTRAFRSSFLFCALLALLALVPVAAIRRRFAP